ncbi:MAG: YitT family protein [Mycoplasmataceae bacterium]|jgi:uncharacterized membrane-anchored protein YitT (DUF2179 family)|nr:YitT family protein [Mycoplasmataceae bacterium]
MKKINIKKINKKKWLKIGIFIVVSALLQSFALNCFYKSSGLLSGGFTGIGLMVNILTKGAIPLSAFILILNIPLALLGYNNIGKRFTILSFINVFLTSFFLTIIPSVQLIDDILLNSIYAGVFYGLGISLALEAGACTGGTDFIALYISVKKQVSAGGYMMALNGIVILISAYFFSIEIAAYTLVATFISSQIVNSIHVRYQRVTLAIISDKGDDIVKKLLETGVHGITVIPAYGGYTHEEKNFIYTVVSTYEVNNIRDLVEEIDENVFVNVTSSQKLFGNFKPVKYD